jgi:hypothetical protein
VLVVAQAVGVVITGRRNSSWSRLTSPEVLGDKARREGGKEKAVGMSGNRGERTGEKEEKEKSVKSSRKKARNRRRDSQREYVIEMLNCES